VQRLGHLLERQGHQEPASTLWQSLSARAPFGWTELDRREARDPDFTPEPVERDARWRVTVRRHPEMDE
jgi:hypothetical protein